MCKFFLKIKIPETIKERTEKFLKKCRRLLYDNIQQKKWKEKWQNEGKKLNSHHGGRKGLACSP